MMTPLIQHRVRFHIRSGLALVLAAVWAIFGAGCGTPQTAKSARSWSLWRDGFATQIDANPIARATRMVYHEGELAGLTTNRKGRAYWFRARAAERYLEWGLLPPASAVSADSAAGVPDFAATLDRMLQNGGAEVTPASAPALEAMQALDLAYKRVRREYRHSTGSYLGNNDGMIVAPALSPQQLKGSSDPIRGAGQ